MTRSNAAQILAGAAAAVVLLAPALWNGFPLIFPDTGGYLERPFLGTLELGRSALYGAFLAAGMVLDFWPNVALQGAMTVWLVFLTLRTHGLAGRPWLAFAMTLMLATGTSLAIYVSQLMPDTMFPAAVLALHLLAFRSDALSQGERYALAAVIALGIAAHMAIVALAAGLLIIFMLLARLVKFAMPKMRLGFAAAAVATGVALCPVSNAILAGQLAFTPGGTAFLFGRLIEDGIVTRYLDEQCPDPTIRLCDYRGDISRRFDDWLWKADTPFWKLGGWKGHSKEERRIILATLLRYPLAHLATAIAATAKQFVSFGSDISTAPADNTRTIDTITRLSQRAGQDLRAARQQAGNFNDHALNMFHVPFAALSLTGVVLVALFGSRFGMAAEARALCLSVLLALVINATICGVFSHPSARYQNRLITLTPLALAVALLNRHRRTNKHGPDIAKR
jgi:hypothetical protein